MRGVRPLIRAWQPAAFPVTAEAIRQARAQLEKNGTRLEAVLVRPEDAQALGKVIDGLAIEADGYVTPGAIFFAVAE